ncbi:MAG TPA: hypothetical protein VGP72_20180 [Planctomycetota bacterium]|jgi:hypothetical protein
MRCATIVLRAAAWVLAAAAPVCCAQEFAVPPGTEDNYIFALMLLERDSSEFSTDDLVEHLIWQLEQNPQHRTDARHIKAALLSHQARSGTPAKRKALLKQAQTLYVEVLTANNNYQHVNLAEGEAASVTSKLILTTIEEATELARTDPAGAAKIRKEAAEQLGQLAAGYKTQADSLWRAFEEIYTKRLKPWRRDNDPDGLKTPPRELADALSKAFDAWWLMQRRYIGTKIEQVECYAEPNPPAPFPKREGGERREPERVAEGAAIAVVLKGHIENEITSEFPIVVAWCRCKLGRVYAALGDEQKAAEEWRTAFNDVYNEELSPEQKKALLAIRKTVLHDLVKMKMRAKKYSDAIEIISEAELDGDLKTIFGEDAGKELLIDYARALTLPAESSAPDYERAIGRLREAIRTETLGRGASTRWSVEFQRTVAELVESARTRDLGRLKLPALSWYDAAHGAMLIGQHELLKHDELPRTDAPARKAQFVVVCKNLQNAVEAYHRAIREARKAAVAPDSAAELARNQWCAAWVTRVEIEPKAWLEMAQCHLMMAEYYEAVVAAQALLETYLPANRGKWLPNFDKPQQRAFARRVQEVLADLDARGGAVARGLETIEFALRKNPNRGHVWDQEMAMLMRGGLPSDDEVADEDYRRARAELNQARTYADNAKSSNNAAEAAALYVQAEAKYRAAAAGFAKVKASSPAYELALYQQGSACTMAQSLWVNGKVNGEGETGRRGDGGKREEGENAGLARARAVEDLAAKGIAAFDAYAEFCKKNPAKTEEDTARRARLEGMVLLARNALHSGAAHWAEVVASADEYLTWAQTEGRGDAGTGRRGEKDDAETRRRGDAEKQSPDEARGVASSPQPARRPALPRGGEGDRRAGEPPTIWAKTEADVALLNKFRAQVELAAANVVPACEEHLEGAEASMRAWRKLKPGENKTYVFMLNMLSRRHNIAAFQIEKLLKEGDSRLTAEMREAHENKVADLQFERVSLQETDTNEKPSLEDYCRLVWLFDKTGRTKACADIAKELLDKFAPGGKTSQLPETEKFWQEMLARMHAVIRYSDLNKWDRCKKDHAVLVDYLYDTVEGVNAASADKRPAFDRFNADLEKASAQIETIKRNYPDCQTLDAKEDQSARLSSPRTERPSKNVESQGAANASVPPRGGEGDRSGRGLLQIVADEVDYRRKILAAREVLFSKALLVATQFEQEKKAEEAKRYREIALEVKGVIDKQKEGTPEALVMTVDLCIALGKYAEALETIRRIKTIVADDSATYFIATRKESEIYALQKKWALAADYPEFLMLTAGDSPRVRELWPGILRFLKECYEHGVPMPAQLRTVISHQ